MLFVVCLWDDLTESRDFGGGGGVTGHKIGILADKARVLVSLLKGIVKYLSRVRETRIQQYSRLTKSSRHHRNIKKAGRVSESSSAPKHKTSQNPSDHDPVCRKPCLVC